MLDKQVAEPPKRFHPALKWGAFVVGLLLVNVGATAVLIVESSHGASRVIPDYYEHGVHYDDHLAEVAHDRDLGWQIDVQPSDNALTVFAADRTGAPLAHATIHVVAEERATGVRRDLTVAMAAAGAYRAASSLHGWLDLSIEVEQGGERFAEQTAVLAP